MTELWNLEGLLGAGGLLTGGMIVLLRVLPVIFLAPAFGGALLPPRTRIALAFLISVVLAQQAAATPASIGVPGLLALGAQEVFVGLSLGISVRLVFELLAAAGAIVDIARGTMTGEQLDPTTQQTSSPLSMFLRNFIIVGFLTAGGARFVLEQLAGTFLLWPPGQPLSGWIVADSSAEAWFELVTDIFGVALALAAPAVIVLFLVDLALGLINRVAPQVPVYFLGLTFKGPLALLVLAGSLMLVFEESVQTVFGWIQGWTQV